MTAAHVSAGLADLRRAPDPGAPLDTQLWYGEAVALLEQDGGFRRVEAARDGYVGWVPAAALAEGPPPLATHRVAQPLTFRFPRPDIKAPPLARLTLNARLAALGEEGPFLRLADGGFVFARHARRLAETAPDWAETARRFLGVPYLWGGRSALGIDCSGLAQTALAAAGLPCPRDSGPQRRSPLLGESLPPDEPPARGDLLFSPGHVVIATGPERVVHANAFHLAVVEEPLEALRRRLAERGEAIEVRRRPYLSTLGA